jgi:hypothetical protein
MIMKYFILTMCLVSVTVACSMIGLSGDQVITSIDNVVPGSEVVSVDSRDLPSGFAGLGDSMVLVDRDDVIDQSDVVEVDSRSGNQNVVGTLFSIGKQFFPWLAAWEGVLTLLFKRKRTHYGNAIRRVIPGSNFSLAGALNSVVAGMGMKHTSEVTEPKKEQTVAA